LSKPKTSASLVLRGLRSALTIALGVLIGVFFMQRWLIYHPQPNKVPLPAGDHYQGLTEVKLTARDGVRSCAWYWPIAPSARSVLFLHGNAGDRSDRLGHLRKLHELGLNVMALDYRGYGGSEGSPSEQGLYLDAEAALEWLQRHADGPLVYLGESLGTGVAVELALQHPPQALILEAPYDTLAAVGRHHFPFLPVQWLLRDRFDSASKIAEIRSPLLVLHGERDTVVPLARGRALFDRANQPKRLRQVAKTGHNDLRARMEQTYYDEIGAWLAQHEVPTLRR